MRWSEKFEKYMTPSRTAKSPPPYSCTRVRALKPSGVTSEIAPPGERRTTQLRPPSEGRSSIQYTSSPSSAICPSPTVAETMRSEVMGDFQEPYGASDD